METIKIRIPDEILNTLKNIATAENTTVKNIIMKALKEYVDLFREFELFDMLSDEALIEFEKTL